MLTIEPQIHCFLELLDHITGKLAVTGEHLSMYPDKHILGLIGKTITAKENERPAEPFMTAALT